MTEQRIGGRLVRGLTLTRPWPWAFTDAGKRVENRTWPVPRNLMGMWIALHAGKGYDAAAVELMREGQFNDAARLCPPDVLHPASIVFALARVTACTEIDCHRHNPDPWAFGPFVWTLVDYRTLTSPIECGGHQGLWRLPEHVFERLLVEAA